MRKKILVVDDEQDIAQIMAYRLSLMGDYDVEISFDGFDAAKKVKTQKFDLIFLDIMMPGIDGLKVCRLLKKDPATSCIPVIIFSALSDSKIIMEAINAGAKDYIVKPFDIHVIQKKVNSILNEKPVLPASRDVVATGKNISDENEVYRNFRKKVNAKLINTEPFYLIPDSLINTQGDLRKISENLKTIVETDIGFSVNLLMIANSVFYFPNHAITNISRAVSTIGTQTVISKIKSMILDNQIVDQNVRYALKDGFMASYLARGYAAKFIAEKESFSSPEDAYCFAVLKDIGRYLILNAVPVEYINALKDTQSTGKKISEFEKRLTGKTVMELALDLMQKWSMPKIYREFFSIYTSVNDKCSVYCAKLYEVVEIADYLIKIAGFAYFDNHSIASIPLFMELKYHGVFKYASSVLEYVKKQLTSLNSDLPMIVNNRIFNSGISSLRFCVVGNEPHYLTWKLLLESNGASTVTLNWDEIDGINTLKIDYFIADVTDIGRHLLNSLSEKSYGRRGIILGKNVNVLKKLIKTFPNAIFKKTPSSKKELFSAIDELLRKQF